jgi:hypothetical protein
MTPRLVRAGIFLAGMAVPAISRSRLANTSLNHRIIPEILDDEFSRILTQLAARPDIKTIIEIGSSSGDGSTKALVEGIKKNTISGSALYCMEISEPRFKALLSHYKDIPFVKIYRQSSVNLSEFPSFFEVSKFYVTTPTNLNKYRLLKVLQWLFEDKNYLKQNKTLLPGKYSGMNGIQRIKNEHNIVDFDLALIDGSEFTGYAELIHLRNSKVIAIDDVNSFKGWACFHELQKDSQYQLLFNNWNVRNGFSVFERISQPKS